jgi:hypothetical protein
MKIGFWVGASKQWGPLFVWLRGFLFEEIHKQLEYLTRVSGVEWRMQTGDAPPWTVEG